MVSSTSCTGCSLLEAQIWKPPIPSYFLDIGNQLPGSTDVLAGLRGLLDSGTTNQTFALRRLGSSLASDLQERVRTFRTVLPQPQVSLEARRVIVERSDLLMSGGRSYGLLGSQTPIIIEWKRYDSTWQGQKGIELRGRIDNLARQLNSDTKPEELLTLKCLGYYDEVQRNRYGFVFSYPREARIPTYCLKELLDARSSPQDGDKLKLTLPTLEDRYRMAYSLSLSIAILHATEWLHKSVRSHNVLVPVYGCDIAWSRPYVAGFEYSRPDKTDESSEKPDESLPFNVYRHPSAQGTPGEKFRKAFDIYSLGVVLLEIGTWRSAWKHRGKSLTAVETQKTFVETTMSTLAHFMGVEYKDAVLKCLNGELENREESVLKAFFVEVVEVLGRLIED